MKSKLLLLLGPTGCGKTTIIKCLENIDSRFVYVKPYTTRLLRENETDKISISDQEIEALWGKGELVVLNTLYGIKYGTPRGVIDRELNSNRFPLIDFPIQKVYLMDNLFPNKSIKVYLKPPNLTELINRLKGREGFEERVVFAKAELADLHAGLFDELIDLILINENEQAQEVAKVIYKYYRKETA